MSTKQLFLILTPIVSHGLSLSALACGHRKRACTTDSASIPHILHVQSFPTIFFGRVFLWPAHHSLLSSKDTYHAEWASCFQKDFHISLETPLVENDVCSSFSISCSCFASRQALLTENIPFFSEFQATIPSVVFI